MLMFTKFFMLTILMSLVFITTVSAFEMEVRDDENQNNLIIQVSGSYDISEIESITIIHNYEDGRTSQPFHVDIGSIDLFDNRSGDLLQPDGKVPPQFVSVTREFSSVQDVPSSITVSMIINGQSFSGSIPRIFLEGLPGGRSRAIFSGYIHWDATKFPAYEWPSVAE